MVRTNEELQIAMDTAEIVARDAHLADAWRHEGALRPV